MELLKMVFSRLVSISANYAVCETLRDIFPSPEKTKSRWFAAIFFFAILQNGKR